MKGILDKYDKVDSGWIVRYKVERGNLIVHQHVMLHPNQVHYAEIDKEFEFRIQSCPNLQNGGEWEDMGIIDTGEANRISEVMEKFKDKIMFPKMVERAKESLKGVKIPNPNETENDWEEILFDFIDFHPCILPNELFEWLEANYKVPEKK
jgi:hypothetical protein